MAEPFLSERDPEVWGLVAQGPPNREIAATLYMSPYTVRWHVSRLLRAFGLRNRTELAVLWSQRGGRQAKTT